MSDEQRSFYLRAIDRLTELGVIDEAARARMIEAGEPDEQNSPWTSLGTYKALLSIALWGAR